MIENPILRGFCPDPSIIRVGEDYYIATSTFEWWPGIKLFHSRDLAHWEQIESPLRRQSQANLCGDPTSGGIWAPCLSFDGSWFYLVYTDVKTKKGRWYNTHNYVVRTRDIRDTWSEPVYLNSVGFDPSLFHDTDGKKYLVNMVNGFKGVLVQEYDPESGQLIGLQKKVYSGSGLGCTEGPHLYHIGSWYYLLVAEGGTGYDHCVTMARAKSVWGPFETAPDNPILTSDRETITALQKCGHADLVQTQNGEWYLVHLCSRRTRAGQKSNLGRETAIQKMEWKDGWLRLCGGGRFAKTEAEEPAGISAQAFPTEPETDDFTIPGATPGPAYTSPRAPASEFVNVTVCPGRLRLTGRESLNSPFHVSLLARRQQELWAQAETELEFSPACPEQLAGLAYVYDTMNFYILGRTAAEDGSPLLTLLQSDGGNITDVVPAIPVPLGPLCLSAETDPDGAFVRFFWQGTDGVRRPIGSANSTELLTDEHCRGFTGAHFGMYVHDMTGGGLPADFLRFTLRFPSRHPQK